VGINGVVLICENPLIEKYLDFVLGRMGRRVKLSSLRHAIEMVQSGEERIDLLITNEPAEFLPAAAHLPFLYLSATPDQTIAARFPHVRVLQKPFRTAELVDAVNDLTSAS
jgi:hypothetical protein